MVCLDPGDRDQEGRELEKEAFRMASGGEDGCKLARDPDLQRELLDLRHTWTEGQDLSAEGRSWRSLQADLFGYGSYGLSSRRQATRIESSYGELNEACR